ncbi:PaaI family thioesterase [Streptomyces lasalocidi]
MNGSDQADPRVRRQRDCKGAAPDTALARSIRTWKTSATSSGDGFARGVMTASSAISRDGTAALGAGTSTVESKANFFRGVTSGTVHATARILNAGRNLIVDQIEPVDDRERLVAQTTQTQIVLTPR